MSVSVTTRKQRPGEPDTAYVFTDHDDNEENDEWRVGFTYFF